MKRLCLLILMVGFLVSCGTKKGATHHKLKTLSVKNVAKLHQESAPQFKTLYARLKGTYEDEYTKQSISISMRMKKNDTIWLSAKLAGLIPLAKALITPDRVLFYEKINNQYFDGDFSLLSKWLGTDLDFEKFQNLLLGQALYPLNKAQFKVESTDKGYLVSSKNEEAVVKSFLIDKTLFRLKSQSFLRPYNHQGAQVKYNDNYQKINHYRYPKTINIIAKQNQKTTKIDIKYQSIKVDVPVSFPFKMPSGYKEIQL